MSGLLTWFAYTRAALTSPQEFFAELEVDGYGIPLSFSLLSITIAAYLANGVQIVQNPVLLQSPLELLFLLILGLVIGVLGGTVAVFAWSGLTHVFVTVFSDGPYQQTVVASAYPTAAYTLLGWIPFIQFAALPAMVYLQFIGLQHLQNLSRRNAAITALLPHVVLFIVGAALYFYAPGLFQTVTSLPTTITLLLQNLII